MKIWLIENGERTGPHEIYDIRDRISNDELNAKTLAWYDGADGWVTLGDVPAYSSYFRKPSSLDKFQREEKLTSDFVDSSEKEGVSVDSKPNSATFKNEPLYPVRRFFARLLDISLYNITLFIIKVQMGINPLVVESVGKELLYQIPYLFLDALALSYLGTTPGKWLLNIKLRDNSGQKLAFPTALIRSTRVWVLGFAMQSPFILISLPFSWFVANKYGKFLWDLPRNHITQCSSLSPKKIAGYFLVIIAASFLLKYTVPPEYFPKTENWKGWNAS